MALEAKFPEGSAYAKFTINESDPRYVDARANAERLGLSQAQFSGLLEHEAKRVDQARLAAENARSTAPSPAPKPVDLSKLSSREQFAHALANGPKPAPVEQTRFTRDTTWAANRRG